MADYPACKRHEFEGDLNADWHQVTYATVESTARATHWKDWCKWYTNSESDCSRRGIPSSLGFCFQSPFWGFCNCIGCETIVAALRHATKVLVLASYANLRSGLDGPELGPASTQLNYS